MAVAFVLVGVRAYLSAGPTCPNPAAPSAEPPGSGVWLGASIDYDHDSVAQYAKRLGHAPANLVVFAALPETPVERAKVDAAVNEAKGSGSMVLLTLEPNGGLDAVTTAVAEDVAHQLNGYNREGVPVIIRFAHEMNGSWYPWGQQPAQYVATFRRVATVVHRVAPGSAMMWAPNYGGGYPFTLGKYAAKPGSEAAKLLDTNHDGKLTQADDPYAPYWPGRKYVDWVGMTIYHFGNTYPWGKNQIPVAGKLIGTLLGTYGWASGDDVEQLRGADVGAGGNRQIVPNFYQIYGANMHVPVAVTETAALYVPGRGGASELAIKQAWWRQLFSNNIQRQFPWLRMINWFEWDKVEAEIGGQENVRVDWTVTRNPRILHAFRADLPSWGRFANDVPRCGL